MGQILDGNSLSGALERIDNAEEEQKGVINFCI